MALPFGIEKITYATNENLPPIPPTVNEITLLYRTLEDKPFILRFLDFKNSVLLKSKESLIKMFNNLPNSIIYLKFIGGFPCHYLKRRKTKI